MTGMESKLAMSRATALEKTLKTMAPLPTVARRVLSIVGDPEYKIDSLVHIVRTDPSLTGRILKLTGSALYALENEITSVGQAMVFIGTRNLIKLVMLSCSEASFANAKKSRLIDPRDVWRHSIACAAGSQWLALRCGGVSPDTAFTAGVLHDVGKIAMSQTLDDHDAESFVPTADGPLHDHTQFETALFGMHHAEAAGVVASAWRLPSELAHAMRSHHDADELAGASPLPAILNVADTLALAMGLGNPFPDVSLAIAPAALSRLRIDPAEVTELFQAHVNHELEQWSEVLNPDTAVGR